MYIRFTTPTGKEIIFPNAVYDKYSADGNRFVSVYAVAEPEKSRGLLGETGKLSLVSDMTVQDLGFSERGGIVFMTEISCSHGTFETSEVDVKMTFRVM